MQYPVFKPEMKDSYTILVPDMLPVHFKLIINILKKYGYNVELLQTSTRGRGRGTEKCPQRYMLSGAACNRTVY